MISSQPATVTSNPAVEQAIVALDAKISFLRRLKLYEALKQGILVVALHELPRGIRNGELVIEKEDPLLPFTSQGSDGLHLAVAFTSIDVMSAKIPGVSNHVVYDACNFLQTILDDGFGGAIIHTGSAWAGIPKEDIPGIVAKH